MLDYNQLAADYARHRRVHPQVFRRLAEAATGRVLEVGCGTGNYITALATATGCKAFGIDPSEEMLRKAAEKGFPVELQGGRAEELPFADAFFDLVFSVDVIHHVQDRPAHMREAHRSLKPGGRLCTVTDSEWVIRHRNPLTAYWPETADADLRRYPAMADLTRFMRTAGFGQIHEELVEFPWELTDSGPYRDKAYSSLYLIGDDAFRRGLERLEADLARGPVPCVSYYSMLWGTKDE
ncbi:MAG TPA: class I SAM-dependent methyltransferase [Symbiobacteriaceae bacterium]|nr:class I SAM-dependent methyltransferase [Symbiobacteriaceae bacterium]